MGFVNRETLARNRLQKPNTSAMRFRVVLDEYSKIEVVRAAAEVL